MANIFKKAYEYPSLSIEDITVVDVMIASDVGVDDIEWEGEDTL